MSRFIEDADGDHIQVLAEDNGALHGVTLAATMKDADGGGTTYHTTVGPLEPHALIEAIHEEMGWDRPSPIIESVAAQINSGELKVDGPADAAIENTVEEDPEHAPRYVHTTPATAEEPRVWAGADEPIIDGLIGRVADLEDEKERTEAHEHLSEHWNRRLAVVRTALSMLPAPGKRGGMLAAFAGEETPDPLRVENALKIARFAADEDRDIPGVDS